MTPPVGEGDNTLYKARDNNTHHIHHLRQEQTNLGHTTANMRQDTARQHDLCSVSLACNLGTMVSAILELL